MRRLWAPGRLRGPGRRLVQTKSTRTPEVIASEKAQFDRDGYVWSKGMFSKEECEILKQTVESDPQISSKVMPMADAQGRPSKLTLWMTLEDDTYSIFGRSRRFFEVAQNVLGQDTEPYHFHTKVMLKEPRIGGAWNWHQDFGYWYEQGLQFPDQCFSAILAIDDHTIENGCLQVLVGSHKLGRIAHGPYNDQMQADPKRVDSCRPFCEHMYCTLEAGDVLFTHSNLLHTSAPNESDQWRRSMIVAYSTKQNEPLRDDDFIPFYTPIDIVDDDAIIRTGVRIHRVGRSDFMSAEDNKDSFGAGEEKP